MKLDMIGRILSIRPWTELSVKIDLAVETTEASSPRFATARIALRLATQEAKQLLYGQEFRVTLETLEKEERVKEADPNPDEPVVWQPPRMGRSFTNS
jgi:hypothetical protein